MSMYGLIVMCAGIQWNVPVTSCSGLSELLTITYTGSTAKMVSSVSTVRRVQMKERGGAGAAPAGLGTRPPSGSDQQVQPCAHKERGGASAARADLGTRPPSGSDQQVHPCDQEQEEQQEDRHRRALAEVPGEERRLVDVDGNDVSGLWGGVAEQHVRRGEVVEGPQEQHQHEDLVDRAKRGHRRWYSCWRRPHSPDPGRACAVSAAARRRARGCRSRHRRPRRRQGGRLALPPLSRAVGVTS